MNDILLSRQNHIAEIVLNRPERHNAFDDELILNLQESLTVINNDEEIRVVILRSNGRSFSAGADLNWMKRMALYDEKENYHDARMMADMFFTLATLTKPTIALVQGGAIGGGVGLVAACDIAIGSPAAFFCLSEVKLGLVPAVISPYVDQAMGERNARRYYLTGEKFDANTADSLGLLHMVTEDLDQAGKEMAATLMNNGPMAMASIKTKLSSYNREKHQTVMDHTARVIAGLRVSQEGQEGITAFLEKRRPNWKK